MKTRLLLVISLFSSSLAFASLANNWKASGYIDGSYNDLLRSNRFTSGIFNRVYDLNPNGITLHQASFTAAYQPSNGFGGLINPMLGHDTFIFAPYGWDPSIGMKQVGFAIPQGYLQYIQHSLTIIGGEMNTLAGEEYLAATKDSNFSRSILWGYAEPTTHLGIRGTYIFNKTISFIAGLNNGWDSIRDTSRRKTLELSLIFTPNPLFSFAAVGYSGGQRAADKTNVGPISVRNLVNLVATIQASKKLTLIASYDYGIQPKAALANDTIGKAVWKGAVGYVNYQFNDQWRSSFRSEFFNDSNGYRTGLVQKWKEITLTIGYALLSNIELRAETRHDFSNVDAFIKANGNKLTNNQHSFALEAVATLS